MTNYDKLYNNTNYSQYNNFIDQTTNLTSNRVSLEKQGSRSSEIGSTNYI